MTRKKHIQLSNNPRAFIQKDSARKAEIALEQGRGQMDKHPYLPFISVQSFSSLGFSFRIPCPKTGELVHLHSIGEASWARILMSDPNHLRLFSQVAMPRQLTKEIADRISIRHPIYKYTKIPSVMTMDFVHLTRTNGGRNFAAYQIKSRSTRRDERSDDLLKISEQYAKDMGWTWDLLFKEDAPPALVSNIKWVEAFVRRETTVPVLKRWCEVEHLLYPIAGKASLSKSCLQADEILGLPRGSSLTVVRYLIANGIWDIDWHDEIEPTAPLNLVGRYLQGAT